MLGVLDRYLIKEIAQTLVAATVVLVVIIFGNLLVRLLTEVTKGSLPAEILLPLLALKGLSGLILLLPVALLLAMMLTLGRLYRDNEMSALRACGIGDLRLYRALMTLTLPLAAALTVLALLASPWSVRLEDQLKARAVQQADISGVAPGRFIEVDDRSLTFFVESVAADHTLRNVFIRQLEGSRTIIETAAWAVQTHRPKTGERVLVLHDGNRYEGVPGTPLFEVLSFETHTLRLPVPAAVEVTERKGRPTSKLWHSSAPGDRAELQRRLSVPISALMVALLALPLSYSSPRAGRYGKLAIAVAIYIVYANLALLAVSWTARALLPAWLGTWWVHALPLAIALGLLVRQHGVPPLAGVLKRR